ncbi:MAG: Rieske 2Fe-2S domain-containing protein [Proteobacteria bacterium]|nr:Rieske 2Fe-2S domain-containing protein [Pseudomonadota bacterium]
MTTAAENEILTRVGPGTPMGGLMRQYWIPAAASTEFEVDGDPVRLKLLGEELIGFRDSNGKVGIMDHRCPHRCASLFFGRNEEGGIRCVYHGWKFDADGNCLDMANVPPHQDFKHKVHAKAYKTAERNGLVWVFMGDQKNIPELPPIEATLAPPDRMNVNFQYRECNWLQAVEGELDTSHVGFLHFGSVDANAFTESHSRNTVNNRAPEYVTAETDYGFMYGAHRPAEEGGIYWRVAHFLFPCWTMPPLAPLGVDVAVRAYVPMDDENTMMLIMLHKGARTENHVALREDISGGPDFNYAPPPTDRANTGWYDRWRLKENKDNDYLIDRELQRGHNYTGLRGLILQDQMITESMEPIVDRSIEVLAPTDIAITQMRRAVLRAAKNYAKDGTLPASAQNPDLFKGARGGHFFADKDANWLDTYHRIMAESAYTPETAQAAE